MPDADSFLEGPVWSASQQRLYLTDIAHGRIFSVTLDGRWELVVQYDGEPTGMKLLDDSRLLVADNRHGLQIVTIADGTRTALLERRNTEHFRGLNDLTHDTHGNLYFTDQGQTGLHDPTGRVYRLAPDGKLDVLLGNCPSPNGIVLSPDEKTLYIAMTRGNCVWRAPLQSDGSVTKVGQYFTSHGPVGPDGLAVNADGALLIANPGLGYVWQLDSRGLPAVIYTSPEGMFTTNLCFGGPDLCTLFVTESETGTILSTRVDRPGKALPALTRR